MLSKINKLTAAATAAATLASFVASATTSITIASAKTNVTTIVWAAGAITHTGLRATLIKKFESEHPNIKVKLQQEDSNTDTTRATLTTSIGGGSATPDVYLGDVIWPAQFGHAQLAEPLNKHLPKSFFSRFAPGLVDGATYQGNIYAAPFFVDSAFLFYRKDLLKKAGLPVPHTWAQVQQEGKQLQQKHLVKYGFVWQGASYEGLTCDFMEYLTDAGGKVLDSSGKAVINSAQAKQALTTMKGFITSGVSPKAQVTFHEGESMNTFAAGDSAFLRNWSYAWSVSQDKSQSKVVGNVGVVPLPSYQAGKSGFGTIGGWDLFLNPHSKNMQAAISFIDWMTGTEAQTIMAKQFNEIPTNFAVQKDPSVKKVSPIMAIASQVHFVSRPDASPNYAQVSQALYTNVNQALAGGASIDAALSKAAEQINSANNGGL